MITRKKSCVGAFKMSIFLHDIGKPKAFNDRDGKISFRGHELIGLEIVERFLKKVRASSNEEKYIKGLVKYHMIFLSAYIKSINEQWVEEVLKEELFNLFYENNERVKDLILLSYCDVISTYRASNSLEEEIKYYDFLKNVYGEYSRYLEARKFIKIDMNEMILIIGKEGKGELKNLYRQLHKFIYCYGNKSYIEQKKYIIEFYHNKMNIHHGLTCI